MRKNKKYVPVTKIDLVIFAMGVYAIAYLAVELIKVIL